MTWLDNHLTKIIGALAALQLLLTNIGDNPLVKLFGSHVEAIITLITAIITALLAFLAPGKSLLQASAPIPTIHPPQAPPQ